MSIRNLGVFSEENFQKLKQGVNSGVRSLGKLSETGFQGLKNHLSDQVLGKTLQGDFKGAGQKIASDFKSLGQRSPQEQIGDALNVATFGGAGVVKKVGGIATKEAKDLLKDSVYEGLKKLEFPATMKNPIEGFETQSKIMQKIEKGTHTMDDLREGSELIKLMQSKKKGSSMSPEVKALYAKFGDMVVDGDRKLSLEAEKIIRDNSDIKDNSKKGDDEYEAAFSEKRGDDEIELRDHEATNLFHEKVHAWVANTPYFKQFKQQFQKDYDSENSEMVNLIEEILAKDKANYPNEKDKTEERFAYVVEAFGGNGLQGIPENLQKYYKKLLPI